MSKLSKKKKLFLGLCLAAAVLGIAYIVYYYAALHRQESAYSAIQQEAEPMASSAATMSASDEPVATPDVEIPIDFASLQAEHPDIYAWIEIPGTDVNYPILQHPTDDTYYLNYNLDGTKGYPGCLYTERCNAKDFSDFNTVIYGHNMKNGTMFGGLKQYRDPDYLQQHREVIVYTSAEKRVYQVFAAVVYSNTYLPSTFDTATESGRAAFLSSLKDSRNLNGQYLDDVNVGIDSEILTLSTCIGGQPNNRYLIEAVYVGE